MHKSKTGYGREPNRIEEKMFIYGINNKQDNTTLDIAKGECVNIVNLDVANTASTRPGFFASSYDSSQVETRSNQAYTMVNGRWIHSSDLGANFVPGVTHKLQMVSHPNAPILFYNGRVYILLPTDFGCSLFCSDTFNLDSMDERHCMVASFDAAPACIGRVHDGLVVVTETKAWFLKMSDPAEEMEQVLLSHYGGYRGTMCLTTGEKLEITKLTGLVCIYMSKHGICVVGAGGQFMNVSQENFSPPIGQSACAHIRERDGQVYYIVSLINADTAPYNAELDTIELITTE